MAVNAVNPVKNAKHKPIVINTTPDISEIGLPQPEGFQARRFEVIIPGVRKAVAFLHP
ncbi:MAG: hypothetical protein ACKO2G_00085 [Verrucomicrobiales bacterium]